MHVGIVGAGIIGVSTAYFLAQKGFQVTLIEKNTAAGLETSFANGAQLSYSYVAPLAGAGVFQDLPKWMLRSDSPLRFIPRCDPHQWKWLLSFMQACNATTAQKTTEALLGLSYHSRDMLNTIMMRENIQFEHQVNGKLIIYRNAAVFQKARAQVELQSRLGGVQQKILNAQETLAQEPSLAAIEATLAGSIYTADEACADCYLLVQELLRTLAAHPKVECLYETEVKNLITDAQGIAGIQTTKGEMSFDHVVIANATQSVPLLRSLGYTPLVYPLKGYSLSIPADQIPAHTTPIASVTDYDRRIVYAPLASQLRVAAMVDIGDTTTHVTPSRIRTLQEQVAEVFPKLPLAQATTWAGLRPATPTGLPIIGAHPKVNNLWLNLGHGALGQTLACGSASLLSQLMTQERPSIEHECFIP